MLIAVLTTEFWFVTITYVVPSRLHFENPVTPPVIKHEGDYGNWTYCSEGKVS